MTTLQTKLGTKLRPRETNYVRRVCNHKPVGQGCARIAWSTDELPVSARTEDFRTISGNDCCQTGLHLEGAASSHNAQLPVRRRDARHKHKGARLNQQHRISDPHEAPTLRIAHHERNSHDIARLRKHECFNVSSIALGAAAPRQDLLKITAVRARKDFDFARAISPASNHAHSHGTCVTGNQAREIICMCHYQSTLMPIAFLRTLSAPVQETGFPSAWLPELLQ